MLPFSPARPVTSPAAEEEIEALLRETIEAGYREESASRIISAYAPEAVIVTHIHGELSREEFERALTDDFERLALRSARLDLIDISLVESHAVVLVNLSVTGALPGRVMANRHDRAWLQLIRGEGGWKIHRQSYRSDFGMTEKPHDFSR